MYFDIFAYLIVALCVCVVLFTLCKDCIRECILKKFFNNDYEDKLTDEEKYKKYIEKKQKELVKYQMLFDTIKRDQIEYKNNVKVINIIEPVGYWTKFVISERLPRITELRMNKDQVGFWQMFISMRSLSQGKHRGRSK